MSFFWNSIARCFDFEVTKFCSGKLLIGTRYTVTRRWENAFLQYRCVQRSLVKNYHVVRIKRLIVDYAVVCLSYSVCVRVAGTSNK